MNSINEKICIYCNKDKATTEDHIIARQFFPNDFEYRNNLPKVPACSKCNTEKQKVEDGPAVLLQFAHASEGSKLVLHDRVPRTLDKNKRLHKSMKKGLSWDWLSQQSRRIDKLTFIELDKRNQKDLFKWYIFLVKGFYYWSLNSILKPSFSISLLKPINQDQTSFLCDIIRNTKDYKEEFFGKKEFHLLFSYNNKEQLSLCSFNFKAVVIFGFTYNNLQSGRLKKLVKRWSWKI